MSTKSDLLKANATMAIDAIVNDKELDDDTKEEVLEELQEHIEEQTRLLSDADEDEDEDEDDEDEGEDEDG